MSKYNLIAVAIAATLAAPAAFADTVVVGPGPDSTPTVLPSNIFNAATVNAVSNYDLNIAADATSVYLGRTTGYNMRITLSQGKFNGDPIGNTLGNTANVSLAGGGDNSNVATFAVTPDAVGGVVDGDGITVTAIQIDGVAALGAGGTINAEVKMFDPVGGGQLGTTLSATLIQTVQGWDVTFTPGAATQRIDVGAASAKKQFGAVAVGSGTLATLFVAGDVAIGFNADLDPGVPAILDTSVALAPLTISGTNFAAFKAVTGGNGGSIYMSDDSACSAAGTIIPFTIATAGDSASIPATTTVDALNASPFLCFDANGKTAIPAQAIGASVAVSQASTIAAPAAADSMRAMMFNGSVVSVDNFNPASNLDQLSYLRISNTSSTAGLVSIDGVCDDGTDTTGVATFTLGAGNTRTVTAPALADGTGMTTGMGTCAAGGKQSLTVTGEFSGLKVQGFTKSRLSSGEVTSNVNNTN